MLEHLIPDLLLYPVNVPHRTIYSDASEVACAPYIYTEGFLVAHKNFDDLGMKQSSSRRELKSVSFVLGSFATILHKSLLDFIPRSFA